MARTLADGRIALVALTTKPAKLEAPTVAELEAGKRLECRINKGDYMLGAVDSSTVEEQELCKQGESKDFGPSAYEGSLTIFRHYTAQGVPDGHNDIAWDLLKTKGTTLWLVEREGPVADTAFAADQEVSVYEVSTDTPQKPSDRSAGFIKRVIKLAILDARENVKIAA